MRLMKYLFILTFVSVFTCASAQNTLKFGNVDTQEVLKSMPEMKTVDDKLQAESNSLEKTLTDMNEELKKLQSEYISKMKTNTLTPEERTKLEQQLQEGNKKVQTFYQTSQQKLALKAQELKTPLFNKVTEAIKAVGQEGGFLYIFEEKSGLTLYRSQKTIDVTPLVKKKLGIQ